VKTNYDPREVGAGLWLKKHHLEKLLKRQVLDDSEKLSCWEYGKEN
jgi:hypothetical protein